MNTHQKKPHEKKSTSVAKGISRKGIGKATDLQIDNNRPESLIQKELQGLANKNPRVKQLKAFQKKANSNSVIQFWPVWVNGVRYKSVNSLSGTTYRLLRLPGSQQRQIYNTTTNVLLPHLLTAAEGDILTLVIKSLRNSGVTNLNAVMTELDAALAAGANLIHTLSGIKNEGANAFIHYHDIPGTSCKLVKRAGHMQYRIFNTDNNTILTPNLTQGIADNLRAVIVALSAQGVGNVDELVKNIEKAENLGIPAEATIARMALIETNIRTVVRIRIQADHPTICGMYPGQLDPNFNNAFVSLEIPGSDPHKGGQVVAFINYRTLAGGDLRVVYKPGDLTIDRLLYNNANSVATELGGDPGVVLSSYQIVNMPQDALGLANHNLAHYGYMEFVPTGGPTTAAQIRSVYRSLGSNLAMAYIFGLRDIHQENFVLKNDSVQFIDMEAATATYTGFNSMEIGSMPGGLPGKLVKRIAEGLVGIPNATIAGWMPNQATLRSRIHQGFTQTLAAMSPAGAHGPQIDALVQTMTHTETRFVPFTTQELQQLAGNFYGRLAAPDADTTRDYNNLTRDLANATADRAGGHPRLADQLYRMLQTAVVRNAFNNGDVPFWTRRGRSIYGEDRNRQVTRLRHNRLNRSDPNEAAANTRRGPANALDALVDFRDNALPLFDNSSNEILAHHRRLRQNAGHNAPNF